MADKKKTTKATGKAKVEKPAPKNASKNDKKPSTATAPSVSSIKTEPVVPENAPPRAIVAGSNVKAGVDGVRNGYNHRFKLSPAIGSHHFLFVNGVRATATDYRIVEGTLDYTVVELYVAPSLTDKMEVRTL